MSRPPRVQSDLLLALLHIFARPRLCPLPRTSLHPTPSFKLSPAYPGQMLLPRHPPAPQGSRRMWPPLSGPQDIFILLCTHFQEAPRPSPAMGILAPFSALAAVWG